MFLSGFRASRTGFGGAGLLSGLRACGAGFGV